MNPSDQNINNSLTGLVCAITTPFKDDNTIDEKMYIEHLNFLSDAGVKRVLVAGTTGEFFSITMQERKRLFTLAKQNFPGKVLFHAGADSLVESKDAALWAQQNQADAIVALTPYYLTNAPQQGMVEYFNDMANAIDIPFILYNFPMHTGNSINAEMLNNIKHFGLKDSQRDMSLIPSTPKYYIGGDKMIVDCYRAGGLGFVSGRVNFAPKLYVQIENALENGDWQLAESLQKKITALSLAVSGSNSIAMFKFALSKVMKNYPPKVRLPLIELNNEEITLMEQAIASL